MPPEIDSTPHRQPVHADADFAHPSHPFALVVNVPLVTMTPANGSTEVWLGTHRDTGIQDQEGLHGERASGRIRESLLEQRREVSPPVQPVVPKGSCIIRDLRLWHAGMPNLSRDSIRVMLAMSKSKNPQPAHKYTLVQCFAVKPIAGGTGAQVCRNRTTY
jgi:ectoine hydroxylase-related dioxygenase (phytanoyl-CoA dioxygenase family)